MEGMATLILMKVMGCMANPKPTMTDVKGMETVSITKTLRLTMITLNSKQPRSDC